MVALKKEAAKKKLQSQHNQLKSLNEQYSRGRNSKVVEGDYVPGVRHSVNSPIHSMNSLQNPGSVLNKQSSRVYRNQYGHKQRVEPGYGSLGEARDNRLGSLPR